MPGVAQQAREAFGTRLREIRLDAGFTARRLAELTGFHFTKISRVEHGGQNLSDTEIRAWCIACGAQDQVLDVIAQARAVESMYREWKRQARGGLRRLQETIEPLYERTRMFRIHEHWSIPGLLQTAAYSNESMKYWARLLDLPDDQDAATTARMDRQRILRAGDHRFVLLLAEQVLRCRVGSAEIMIEQLDRVLASMTMPNVLLGIIPSTAGLGAHTQTAFWIFDDDLVKVETLTAALDITRPSEISIYATAFAQMRQAAVFGTAARTLVLQARDQLLQLSATSSPITEHPRHGGSGDVRLRPAGASGIHGERERFPSLRGASMSVVTQRARGWYVAVEGPTGAGKTTLAGRLAPLLAAESSMDPFEANPFLAQAPGLGQSPGQDASLATEMTFLALRVIELRRIGALLRSGADVIADWALTKTRVFLRTTLTPDDADRVEAACSLWEPSLCMPDLIIYLHASPSVLANRIARRGRAFEQAITIEDLARLTALFGNALQDLRVLRVNAAAFDVFDDTAVAALARQLNAIRKETADDCRHPARLSARQVQITAPGKVQLTDELLPQLTSSQVVARTLLSGISHGTEMAWYRGKAAALHKGWDRAARLYLDDGEPRAYPVAPGYESVAVVEMIGSDAEGLVPGALVYLDRPHADLHIVDGSEAARGRIPQGVAAEHAVFHPLARVALGAVHDAAIQLGGTVAITGLGVVGLLAAQLARRAGASRVIGIDRYPLRLKAARRLGAEVIDATATPDLAVWVREMTGGRGADAVIEASGSYRLLHQAIRSVATAGRVVTVASYHGDQRGLSLGEEYQRNRITLISSMTIGGVPHRNHPAWDLDRLNTAARDLVNTGALTTSDLITHRIPFEDADAAYELIDAAPQTTIKVVLTYDH